jgi:hypothetical protein
MSDPLACCGICGDLIGGDVPVRVHGGCLETVREYGRHIARGAAPQTVDVERLRDLKSAARAAYLFMNMVRCPDCRTSWPEGYVHPDCPALALPVAAPETEPSTEEADRG